MYIYPNTASTKNGIFMYGDSKIDIRSPVFSRLISGNTQIVKFSHDGTNSLLEGGASGKLTIQGTDDQTYPNIALQDTGSIDLSVGANTKIKFYETTNDHLWVYESNGTIFDQRDANPIIFHDAGGQMFLFTYDNGISYIRPSSADGDLHIGYGGSYIFLDADGGQQFVCTSDFQFVSKSTTPFIGLRSGSSYFWKVVRSSDDTIMYGGPTSSDDTIICAGNTTNNGYINIGGCANIALMVSGAGDSILMKENRGGLATQVFKFMRTDGSPGYSRIFASSNSIPYVTLYDRSSVYITHSSNKALLLRDDTKSKTYFKFYHDDDHDRAAIRAYTAGEGILLSGARVSVSSQLYTSFISCQTYHGPNAGGGGSLDHIRDDDEITGWDADAFANSGIMWNGSNWVAMPSGGSGGGVSKLSDLSIDDDKDWNDKSIYNLTSLSSQTISGGTIKNLYLPADYIIFSSNTTYYAKDGHDGSLDYSSDNCIETIQYALDTLNSAEGGTVKIIGRYYRGSGQLDAKSNVNVLGPTTIEVSSATNTVDGLDANNITNSIWKDIKIIRSGSVGGTTYVCNVRGTSTDSTFKMINCEFDNRCDGNTGLHGLYTMTAVEAEFYNCIGRGGTTASSYGLITWRSSGSMHDCKFYGGGGKLCHGALIDKGTTTKYYNCYFEGSYASGGSGVYLQSDANPTMIGCFGKGGASRLSRGFAFTNESRGTFINCIGEGGDFNAGTSQDSDCCGWIFSESSGPYLNGCIGRGGAGGRTAHGLHMSHAANPQIHNTLAVPGAGQKSTYGLSMTANSSPKIENCAVTVRQESYDWDYVDATPYFRPYSGHPYQLLALTVDVDVAADPGTTLKLGTTLNGSEIASGIPIDATTQNYLQFNINKVMIPADGYIYVSGSDTISDGDIEIRYATCKNYEGNFALYIKNSGNASIKNSSFLSNGSSSAFYVDNQTSKNWSVMGCSFETLDETGIRYAIEGEEATTDLPVWNSSYKGGVKNITSWQGGLHTGYISAQSISGGHIITSFTAASDNDVVNKKYFDDNVGSATLAGNLVGNLSGNSYTYGLKDMGFLSSQTISGTSKNIRGPANYVIYYDGSNYVSRKSADGSIGIVNSDADRTIEETWGLLAPSGGIIQLISDVEHGQIWTINQTISSQSEDTKIISQHNILLKSKASLNSHMFFVSHDYVTLDGFYLDGWDASNTTGDCIRFSSASHPMVYNTWIYNSAGAGIHTESMQGVGNFDRLHIRDGNGWGFYMNTSDNSLSNSDIEGNAKGGLCISGNGWVNFINNVHLGWHANGPGVLVNKGYRNSFSNITVDEAGSEALKVYSAYYNMFNGFRIRASSKLGADSYQYVLVSWSNNNTFNTFHIDHMDNHDYYPDYFFKIDNSDFNSLNDFNLVGKTGVGFLHIYRGENNQITDVNIRAYNETDNRIGVHLDESDHTQLTDCIMIDCSHGVYVDDEDGSTITNCSFYSCPSGISAIDGDDLVIQGCKFDTCTYPININNSNVVSPYLIGNSWRNCTNDPLYASATNERITDNIDKNGDFWSVDGNSGSGTPINHYVYPDDELVSEDGSDNLYFSGQGTTYVYSGANTIIISSQIGSAGNLSDLTIDADKDWNSKGISNSAYISASALSGSWTTPIYRGAGKPAAGVSYEGQIIRTSGASGEKTYVWMCVKNDADGYEWIQLAVST